MKLTQASLLILLSLALPTVGQAAKSVSFEGLSTSSFRIVSARNCALDGQLNTNNSDPLGLGKRNWVPSAEGHGLIPPECSPTAIEDALIKNRRSSHAQGSALQKIINTCERPLKRYGKLNILALRKLSSNQYNLCQHPNIRQVNMTLPDGKKLNAILALKPGSQPRPLVLVKCGALCNVGDASHRFLIMHFFDESPFHVLAIGNGTGSEFVKSNGYFTLGGFDEGQQLIHVARLIKDGALNSRVSSIHFAGVSLGSHAGLFGTLLNEYHQQDDGKRYIQSTLAICPVVDLKYSMNAMFRTATIQGYVAKKLFLHSVAEVVQALPILEKLFPFWPFGNPETAKIPGIVADAAMAHYRKKSSRDWLTPFKKVSIDTPDDLWRYNQFLGYTQYTMTTPTLIIAARDDEAVPYEGNAKRLKEYLAKKPETQISVVSTAGGSHCAQNLVYNWQTTSSMYRSFILAHSPELLRRQELKTAKFAAEKYRWSDLPYPGSKIEHVNFKFTAGSDQITVTYKTRLPRGVANCQNLYSDACMRTAKAEIPMAAFRGASEWLYPPRNHVEAQAMTRWANVNVRVAVPAGNLIDWPGTLKWFSYEN